MSLSPIIIFVYNRPSHTKLMLESLSNCDYFKESKIFVFIDGPKKDDDKFKLNQVKKEVLNFKHKNKNVKIIQSKKNLGTYLSVINGVNRILKKNDKVIVLEDDLRLKKNFLEFMNKSFIKYFKYKNIFQISGYAYPIKISKNESYFLNLTSCWGWGIWKDRWQDFYKFLSSKKMIDSIYQNIKKDKFLKFKFNINNSYNYLNFLKKQLSGNFNSWGVLFYLYSYQKNKLNLFPAKSFIVNDGFDGSGLHKSTSDIFNLNSKSKRVSYTLSNKITNNEKNLNKISIFLKKELSIFKKIKNIFS